MKRLGSIAAYFSRRYDQLRLRQFKLTANYGQTIKVIEFRSTLGKASGKTIKTYAWDGADKATLEELVDNNWSHVFTRPSSNLATEYLAG
jgi:hypothetical protein